MLVGKKGIWKPPGEGVEEGSHVRSMALTSAITMDFKAGLGHSHILPHSKHGLARGCRILRLLLGVYFVPSVAICSQHIHQQRDCSPQPGSASAGGALGVAVVYLTVPLEARSSVTPS